MSDNVISLICMLKSRPFACISLGQIVSGEKDPKLQVKLVLAILDELDINQEEYDKFHRSIITPNLEVRLEKLNDLMTLIRLPTPDQE
jgi:hypothetical protein